MNNADIETLGFVDFVPLSSLHVDGYFRKTRTEVYEGRFITFQIICFGNDWQVEAIFWDMPDGNNKKLQQLFGCPYQIDKVLKFVKELQT
jgi:hypothetical protein